MDFDVTSAGPRSSERSAEAASPRQRDPRDAASTAGLPASRLLFDRATGTLSGATLGERLAALIFQAGARISSLWSYRGFNAGCKAMQPVIPAGDVTVRLNDDALFSFPFGDGYWGLLLDTSYSYERDIERFFRGMADAEYTLIDCGANYGYWSVLVTSAPYGAHESIAIEPSSRNFARLTANAGLNGDRFATLQRAIGAANGMARLSGRKHEALSIAGEQDADGEDVPVMALDALLDGGVIRQDGRFVIKLDVEGVEIDAIRGGVRLLQTDCVVICEEHGNDPNHTVSRYILDNTSFKLFCFDPTTGKFEHLKDVSALDHIKRASNFGYNVLATASSFWEQRIRSLGSRTIAISFWMVRLSRFIGQHFSWHGPAAPNVADWLIDLAAKHDLRDWLLVPGGDGEVRMISEHRKQLGSTFRVLSCDWNELQTVCDKHLLGERATKVGIASPRRYQVSSETAATSLDLQFPVVLKPAVRETRNAFTQAKAWRADSREEFITRYRDAAIEVGNDQVVVQEMIVGGGEAQFSYVALWKDGRPLASMTARRTRQYPIDFSYTSTFVEVVERPEVKAAAETLLASIGYEGLAEVEFKYDARDGAYKVLDVNPRTWTWIGLGEAAGVDFAWLMVCAAYGRAMPACRIDPEQKWIYAVRDAVAAFRMVARGDLSLKAYIASLRRPFVWAAFAIDDPLPGLLELPLTVFRVVTKRLPASFRKTPAPVKSAVRGAVI